MLFAIAITENVRNSLMNETLHENDSFFISKTMSFEKVPYVEGRKNFPKDKNMSKGEFSIKKLIELRKTSNIA